MAKVTFISEATLKDRGVYSDNIDPKYIKSSIIKAQDKELEPVLGTNLYDALQDKVILNKTVPGTLTADEVYLIEKYIIDMLVPYSIMHSQIELAYKFQNKGIHKKTDENNTAAPLDEIRALIEYFKDDAEWYKSRLINYLIANKEKFPDYDTEGCEKDKFSPVKKAYTCPINI